jgi:hypothetical protein
LLSDYGDDLSRISLVADNADYAVIAWAAYGYPEALDAARERGWIPIENIVNANLVAGDTVATRFLSAEGEQVLAFRGSKTGGDWFTNIVGTFGVSALTTSQITGALQVATDAKRRFPDIVFVGHSLGGRLADVARLRTGNKSVVFYSAPLGVADGADAVVRSLIKRILGQEGPKADTLRFRNPRDALTLVASPDDLEVSNSVTAESFREFEDLNVGPLAPLNFVAFFAGQQNHVYHNMGMLAGAMQYVRIARDEGWITQVVADRAVPPVHPDTLPDENELPISPPAPHSEHSAAVEPSAKPELPFLNGRYVTDKRMCDPTNEFLQEMGDRAYTMSITINGNTLSRSESICTISNVSQQGIQLTLSGLCDSEGDIHADVFYLVRLSDSSFQEFPTFDSFDSVQKYTLCPPSGSVVPKPPLLGRTADLFNIFDHLLQNSCGASCEFSGVEGQYIAQKIVLERLSPDHILSSCEMFYQQGINRCNAPGVYFDDIRTDDLSSATVYHVERVDCLADVCTSAVVALDTTALARFNKEAGYSGAGGLFVDMRPGFQPPRDASAAVQTEMSGPVPTTFEGLLEGNYRSDPALCGALHLADPTMMQRQVSQSGIVFGHEEGCEIVSQSTQNGATTFKGQCFVGPERVPATWVWRIESPTTFTEESAIYEVIGGFQNGQRFALCPDEDEGTAGVLQGTAPVPDLREFCASNPNDPGPGEDGTDDPEVIAASANTWRCMDGKVLICQLGASGRACLQTKRPTKKVMARLRSFCRSNPNFDFIPLYLTSSLASEWRCKGKKPSIVSRIPVDRLGYFAESWYPLASAQGPADTYDAGPVVEEAESPSVSPAGSRGPSSEEIARALVGNSVIRKYISRISVSVSDCVPQEEIRRPGFRGTFWACNFSVTEAVFKGPPATGWGEFSMLTGSAETRFVEGIRDGVTQWTQRFGQSINGAWGVQMMWR